ncbi:hypothetical protein [Pseudomonas sp. NPDC089569]|uniref:hypothetical protein n=1 Tax=Pseudomonas sp. NPDC089569 TaxID=3390722 RepID=UPI003D046349
MRLNKATRTTFTIFTIGVASVFAMCCAANFVLTHYVQQEVDENAKYLLEVSKLETDSVFFNMSESKPVGTKLQNSDQSNQKTLYKISQKYKFNDIGGEQWPSVDGFWWAFTLLDNPPLKRSLGLHRPDLISQYQVSLGESPTVTKSMALRDGFAIRIMEQFEGNQLDTSPLTYAPIWVSQTDTCRFIESQKLTCTTTSGEYQLEIKQIGERTLVTVNDPGFEPFYLF